MSIEPKKTTLPLWRVLVYNKSARYARFRNAQANRNHGRSKGIRQPRKAVNGGGLAAKPLVDPHFSIPKPFQP